MNSRVFPFSVLTSIISIILIPVFLSSQVVSSAPAFAFVASLTGYAGILYARRGLVSMKDLRKKKLILKFLQESFEAVILYSMLLENLVPDTLGLTGFILLTLLKILKESIDVDDLEKLGFTSTKYRIPLLIASLAVLNIVGSYVFYAYVVYVSLLLYRALAVVYILVENLVGMKIKNKLFLN